MSFSHGRNVASSNRVARSLVFNFASGETDSTETISLDAGVFGTILVEADSDLIGKTLQVVAVANASSIDPHPDTELLSTAKTLAAGANALSSYEVVEVGAAARVKLQLGSSVSEDSKLWLLWKS